MAHLLSAAAFAETFRQWDRLRRFEGFDTDEFVDRFECSAAEDDFADRVAALERTLLGRSPETLGEVICMLAVIAAGEDLGPASSLALGRIQVWLGGQTGLDPSVAASSANANTIVAVARADLAML